MFLDLSFKHKCVLARKARKYKAIKLRCIAIKIHNTRSHFVHAHRDNVSRDAIVYSYQLNNSNGLILNCKLVGSGVPPFLCIVILPIFKFPLFVIKIGPCA